MQTVSTNVVTGLSLASNYIILSFFCCVQVLIPGTTLTAGKHRKREKKKKQDQMLVHYIRKLLWMLCGAETEMTRQTGFYIRDKRETF